MPHPSLQAPPPRLVAQLVWDQKQSCKQPMKRVTLWMTPSLNYSVFHRKPGHACCHHGGMYCTALDTDDACYFWTALKKTVNMFNREFDTVVSSSSRTIRLASFDVCKSNDLSHKYGLNAEGGFGSSQVTCIIHMHLTFDLVCVTVLNGTGLDQKPWAAHSLSEICTKNKQTNQTIFDFLIFHFLLTQIKENTTSLVQFFSQ